MSLHRGNRALTQPCVERVLLSRALVADLRASGHSVTTGTVNYAAILASLCHLAWMRSQASPHERCEALRRPHPHDAAAGRVSPHAQAQVGGVWIPGVSRCPGRGRGRLLRSGAHKCPHYEYSQLRAGPAARIPGPGPDATDGATRATRREAWVTGFDCGAGAVLHGAIPPARWPRPIVIDRAGVLALFLARGSQQRVGKASKEIDAHRRQSGGPSARRADS